MPPRSLPFNGVVHDPLFIPSKVFQKKKGRYFTFQLQIRWVSWASVNGCRTHTLCSLTWCSVLFFDVKDSLITSVSSGSGSKWYFQSTYHPNLTIFYANFLCIFVFRETSCSVARVNKSRTLQRVSALDLLKIRISSTRLCTPPLPPEWKVLVTSDGRWERRHSCALLIQRHQVVPLEGIHQESGTQNVRGRYIILGPQGQYITLCGCPSLVIREFGEPMLWVRLPSGWYLGSRATLFPLLIEAEAVQQLAANLGRRMVWHRRLAGSDTWVPSLGDILRRKSSGSSPSILPVSFPPTFHRLAASGATVGWSCASLATVLRYGSAKSLILFSAARRDSLCSISRRTWVSLDKTDCDRSWSTCISTNLPSVRMGAPVADLGVTAFQNCSFSGYTVFLMRYIHKT